MKFFTKNQNLKKKMGVGDREVGEEDGGGGIDGRTVEQAQTSLPLQLLRSRGITMNKCTSYGPDKLNL